MERIRLNRADVVFTIICILVIIIGTWISLTQFKNAFPEASIDFKIDRNQAGGIAEDFLDEMEIDVPEDYKHASRFGYDGLAKTYLEKELSLENAQPYFGNPVRLWYWQHRWFKPSTKEEFSVFVTPSGEVVRLRHMIEEEAEGAEIEEDSAIVIAENFLFETMDLDSASLVFWEASKIGRPNRADWNITYKAKGIEPVEGSDYRYRVTILGDKIGGYSEYLHVPETWRASYRKLRSYNELASTVAAVGLFLTIIAIVAVILMKLRGRDIQWKTAFWFGLIMAVLLFLNQLNSITLSLYGYDTTSSWSGFLIRTILGTVLISIGSGVFIFVLTAGAETMYRERYSHLPSLPVMFTPRGLRTKSAFKNILLGITLTPFFFAYQIGIYLLASKSGGWSPADVPYDNLLNTMFPWAAVLLIGFMPAVSEEFMSRAFSIPFLEKLFKGKVRWLAVLIPAIIWGFGHANYPSQPWWIRGVEVGVAGIIIGYIMLRFGILAALVWHYTVDAFYTALLLFESENIYFVITAGLGAGLLIIPLLIALIVYLKTGTFLPEKGTLNADLPPPELKPPVEKETVTPSIEQISREPDASGKPLTNALRIVAVVLLLVGVAVLFVPSEKVGDFIEFPVTKEQAVQVVKDSLRATGWADPDTMKLAAFVRQKNNTNDELYALKHLKSVTEFNELFNHTKGAGYYKVYAWVPENRLRFTSDVHGKTGRIEQLHPRLPEEMEGDSLSEDSARALLEPVLEKQGYDLSNFRLESHVETARPKRIDHTFIFEALEDDPRHLGEAKFRIAGGVNGSWVSSYERPYFHIPEKWKRDRKATTTTRAIFQYANYLCIATLIGIAVAYLVVMARRGLVPWKKSFLLAIIPGVLVLPNGINIVYLAQETYINQVAIPWNVFKTTSYISVLISLMLFYLLFALGFALLGGLFSDKRPMLTSPERKKGSTEAWFTAFAGLGALFILRWLTAYLALQIPEWYPFGGWEITPWLAMPVPIAAMVQSAFAQGLLITVFFGMVSFLWTGPMKMPLYRVLLLVIILIALMGDTAREPGEWILTALFRLLTIAVAWGIIVQFVRGRAASLFALSCSIAIYNIAAPAIVAGNSGLAVQGWIFVALAVGGLAVWLMGVGRKKQAVR